MVIFVLLFFTDATVNAGLFKPYKWSDKKGNWVRATKGTLDGKRPNKQVIPIKKIKDQFFGINGAGFSYDKQRNYVKNELTLAEQEAFFKALQKALKDTGKVEYKLNIPGTYKTCIGTPHGFAGGIFPITCE